MGRILAVIVILLIAIGVLGYYRDWWRLNKTTQGDEIDITVSVDKKKIKKDADAAVEQVQKIGKNVQKQVQKAMRETVQGKVASISPADGAITVSRAKAEPLSIHTTNETTITRDNEAVSLAELQVDQPVTVVYDTKDGKNIAHSITVDAK